jgi:asparagine synthase (glutamine-hydrolysing)
MCGIAGIINFLDARAIERMTDVQAHRGPDDRGIEIFQEQRIALGHRRLSIIDLSPAGHQPMSNDDESIWITFNGEIYNFPELRKSLEDRGARFKSKTDTEVIIRLYEDLGAACVKQLNGMFAFAILDLRKQILLLARDHCGVKPLYYHQQNGRLVFASEIKGILASGQYSTEVNWQAVDDYFTYLYVPCPDTMFRDIYQLPPAHTLEVNLRTNDSQLACYWEPDAGVGKNGQADYSETKRQLRQLLTDSTTRQMISDVPLGVFLSGGVDSPILTGLMAASSSRPVKTFTVSFRGGNLDFYNERDQALAVSKTFATEHHEIAVDISQPLEMLDLIESFDQPFGNPTFYLMHLISRAARETVTVALSGVGGDELFAGYPRYRAAGIAKWFHQIPHPLLAATSGALDLLSDDYRSPTLRRARQFVAGLDNDLTREFVNWTYFLTEDEKRALMMPSGPHLNGGRLDSYRIVRKFLESSRLTDSGNRLLHVDVKTFLPDNILEYTDKMSMATSLEVRVPYLDYRLVEQSLSWPFEYKLRSNQTKAILKETFADLLPEENSRAAKRGFNFPLAVWMRDKFDGYFETEMNQSEVGKRGLFDWRFIQSLRQQHRDGKKDNSYPLFALIMFDAWYRKYVIGSPAVTY